MLAASFVRAVTSAACEKENATAAAAVSVPAGVYWWVVFSWYRVHCARRVLVIVAAVIGHRDRLRQQQFFF